jgi:ATP-dependent DNA helicase RecG
VGPARAAELAKAGVETVLDLLLHLPFRYEDRSRIAPINALVPGGPPATIKGSVLSSRLIRTRRSGFTIFEAILDDGSASVRLVFFNQPYLSRWLVKGKSVYAFGAAELGSGLRHGLTLQNPQLELEDTDDPLSVGRVVPIYRKLPGLTPRQRRKTVAGLLDAIADRLPDRLGPELAARHRLPPLAPSLREAHFPGSAGGPTDPVPWETRTSPHLKRLVFEEFLEFQVALGKRKRARAKAAGPRLLADDAIRARLREVLPFALTGAQRRVIAEIRDDFRSGRPMRRLLQGDVGSGKTIVAVLAALLAAECGYQTALMAPTEVLAEQHYRTIFELVKKTRFVPELLTGRVKGKKRAELLDRLAGGRIHVLVGTHALLTDPVAFHRLGLAVVDEQHRFGVSQRAALSSRVLTSGERPHLLVMSATPIPRSLALTLWGDLDASTLDERPPGRHPIATRILPAEARAAVLHEIEEEIAGGGQAYVVMPLVEESDKIDAVAVEKHVAEIRRALPGRRVGMVHGRIPAEDREKTMMDFAAGWLDVLAATTVIEVGVDVANASYLLVENAERFGLAQLHQLRGRVGRGSRRSRAVFLMGANATLESRDRLEVLGKTEDGFAIAEEDLRRRGPGDALGTRQSGVPFFRVGDLLRDLVLLHEARTEAERLAASGGDGVFEEKLFFRGGEIPESD